MAADQRQTGTTVEQTQTMKDVLYCRYARAFCRAKELSASSFLDFA